MEAALSPAEIPHGSGMDKSCRTLWTPRYTEGHIWCCQTWVQAVVVPEQLESPISPLPDRPRGEAHSQEAHTRQQQWKCRRRRSNSCHQQGCHLLPQGSHLPCPLTGHVCPPGHLTTPTHHLSKLKSNTGNHLSSHQTQAPSSKLPLLLGKGCVDFRCMQSNIKHVCPFKVIKRAPTLQFLLKYSL